MKYLFPILLLLLSTTILSAQGGVVTWIVDGEERSVNTDILFYRIVTEGYTPDVQKLNMYYFVDIVDEMPYEKQLEQVELFRKAGKKHKSKRLSNEADYIEIWYFPTPTDSLTEVQISMMEAFIKRMEQQQEVEFIFRGHEFISYRLWGLGEYARAFKYFGKIDKLLEQISDVNKTGVNAASKKSISNWFGNCYYQFKDYDKAIYYFKRATDSISPHLYNPYHQYDEGNLRARNSLGIHYRRAGDLETSDQYFNSMLEAPDSVKRRDLCDGLALCNLGQNALRRKDYNKAIELITQGLPSVLKYKHQGNNNYNFAGEVSISLGECYLIKHDFAKTKQMIDSAKVYIQHAGNTDHYGYLYSLMSKYLAHVADPCLAIAWMDSAGVAQERTNEKYNSLILLRAEQELFAIEKEEIRLHKQAYRDRWISISILALFLLSGLTIVLYLYYNKRQSYKLLIKRSLEWSQIPLAPLAEPISIASADKDEIADPKADLQFMKKVCRIVETEKLYILADFTVADLGKRMNISTAEMSKIGNRTMGMNFKSFINEYRIKEAIKILSSKNSPSKMEYFFREIGFKDRTSFYRSFKKMTGLSPSEFIKNNESIDDSIFQ